MEIVNQAMTKRILIIDDSHEAIDVLGATLPKEYKRQIALSGESALELLNSTLHLPDLILLDVMMPGMSGFEVCEYLKSHKRFAKIPIIFISALSETFDKVKAFQLGGVDYITKPFQREEVIARTDTHLKLHFLQKMLEENNLNLEKLVDEKVAEITESQMATIDALAKLAESRDYETGNHLERIKLGCRLITEELRSIPDYGKIINDEYVENIQNASVLHDIGKVGIKDSILLKPGKLTPEEFDQIKQHSLIGAETLIDVNRKHPGNLFILFGITIARSHHERWDGSGYPDGLAGEDIPLSARIVAVADTYDALRSQRPYKKAFSHADSCEIIINSSGSHFDPLIVQMFVNCEKDLENIYATLLL